MSAGRRRTRGRAFVTAAVAGCPDGLVGLVGGGFRWCPEHADLLRAAVLQLTARFAAAVTADRLGSEPVYDTLRRRMPDRV
ncbi:hypothetical protein [Streptomyces yangpuensis]|uniref:hypothetical protein n=1 Tax=Streptomyces yangpuensis TaxID=1648182 RepID=UPI0036959029